MTVTATREAKPATGRSWRRISPLLVLRLQGSQEAMGARHGRLLRGLGGWESTRGFYSKLPERLLFVPTGSPLDGVAKTIGAPVLDLLLRRLDRARPPELRARSRAFFRALGQHRDEARYVLVMDLFQNMVGLGAKLGLLAPPEAVAPACSTLMAWGGATRTGELLHARNFDFPGIGVWDRAPALVFCTPERGLRYAFVATRGADTPGVTAFNEAGITMTVHTRLHRDVRFSGTGVVDLGHEIVRRSRTLDEAVAIAKSRPVASTWGIAISSSGERRAVSVETTGRAVEVVQPGIDGTRTDALAVTNHYRTPSLRVGEAQPSPAWLVHSRARARRLDREAAKGGLDADDLERLLGDHDDGDDGWTPRAAGSVVSQCATVQSVVVAPERRSIRVSVGGCPAGWGPYVEVPWTWDGDEAEEIAPPLERSASHRFSGTDGEAYGAFLEAARTWFDAHDVKASAAALDRAVALHPDEPRYRFFAGLMALKSGDATRALAHLEHGLAHEGASFRRANLLIYASRAAAALGRADRAREHRHGLEAIPGIEVEPLKRAARSEEKRPLSLDALRRIQPNFLLADCR